MFLVGGDIGGTKTNVGLFDLSPYLEGRRDELGRRAPRLVAMHTYPSGDHDGLEEIVTDFATRVDVRTRELGAVCFGIAGPVIDNHCKTPNLPWEIDGDALGQRFAVPSFVLVNDLVANAEGIGALLPDELVVIQQGAYEPDPQRPGALVAPGTGLGMAILCPGDDGDWTPLASEGGHADFAAQGADEAALVAWLAQRFPDHVSAERLLSGPGLRNIYDFLASQRGAEADATVRAAIEQDPKGAPRLVSEAAQAETCAVCVAALDRFVRVYGAIAGNLALSALATGGVFLGGGISPKIRGPIESGAFLHAFRAKGRLGPLMELLPVRLILNSDTAMLGAARRAARDARRRG
jgi:glucokinase